jgi:hypothetical protein
VLLEHGRTGNAHLSAIYNPFSSTDLYNKDADLGTAFSATVHASPCAMKESLSIDGQIQACTMQIASHRVQPSPQHWA